MDTTSGIQNFWNSCRFCGESGMELIEINSHEKSDDISNKIKIYFPKELKEKFDNQSLKSCEECINTIKKWDEFIEKAVETEKKFQELNRVKTDCDKIEEMDKEIKSSSSASHPKQDQMTKNEDKHDLNASDSFLCSYCTECFSSESILSEHIKEIHDNSDDTEYESDVTSKNISRKNRTKIDPKLINDAKVIINNRVYYNCKECGKSLYSPYTYLWHIRIHTGEKPFVCDLCGKQFRISQGLVRHLKETHEGIKNFPCDICGRMFSTKRNADEHRRTHTDERPYICALCGKSFRQKASLFVHNRVHTDHFPFKCEYCNQKFRTKPRLLLHVTTHTGEKPHSCDVCGRCFRVKNDLKRHKLVHSEEKPFICSICGLKFKQKRYLMNHSKTNH